MRKLKLQVQVSLDGFIAGPDNEMDWMTWNWDDKLKEYVKELTNLIDCIILGRVLAEGFIPVWKERAAEKEANSFSHKMVDTLKVVFTKTIQDNPWQNTDMASGDLTEEINKLKNAQGGDIIAYGGARFVSSLIKNNLIDEYHLFINPVAIGKGKPIYQELDSKLNLNLIRATPFECGITVLCYKPAAQ